MSTLWATFGQTCDTNPNVVKLIGKAKVTLSGGDVSLAAAPDGTQIVSLCADAACNFELGSTASASTFDLASGERVWFQCGPGMVIHGYT